ncbi:MAG: hypothetical protein J6C86_06440 [Bacteroidaceae bacterium]|nr:hypothetical protein [Bacteroidaceae bacterium]
MNRNELDPYFSVTGSVLLRLAAKINKWCEKLMLEVLLLYSENSKIEEILNIRTEEKHAP